MPARILLVEDNEMNREMLSRRLLRKGYEVVIAVDGLKVSSLLEKVIASYPVGGNLCIHAFRRDELMTFQVCLQAAPFENCVLALPAEGEGYLRAEQWILDK